MTDEALTQYRSYAWEDEHGIRYVAAYPGDEEADEEYKAQLRAMGARVAADLVAEQEAEHEPKSARPSLRLIRGGGSS
ncbi:hypothetical protein F7Q99_00420 [Streptomyces kaniharaensis]|uniref:Uncharacterized protein n=1 Tax=Streptomyces kaniharaensis TaxID=212423 RepID=A0A6N7KKP5_9ACTN|nr:hypothetical protein [Streptomyces kaniharaensis]MQS10784.1 hypothetical protein [Streptomyces kaniharaensis]